MAASFFFTAPIKIRFLSQLLTLSTTKSQTPLPLSSPKHSPSFPLSLSLYLSFSLSLSAYLVISLLTFLDETTFMLQLDSS